MKIHAHTSPATRAPCPGKFKWRGCYLGMIRLGGRPGDLRHVPILTIAWQCPACGRVVEQIHADDREKLYLAYGREMDLPILVLGLELKGTDGACGP